MRLGSRSSSRRRRSQALAACVGVALLGACGDIHPGAAADVAGYRISMGQADAYTHAFCKALPLIAVANGQANTVTAAQGARAYVVGALVQNRLTELAAQQVGVSLPAPADYAVDPKQYEVVTNDLSSTDAADFLALVTKSKETSLLLTEIGQTMPKGTNPTDAQRIGRSYVANFAKSVDISIDPRIGLSSDLGSVDRSGSLSVAVSDGAVIPTADPALSKAVAALPAEQTCGA